jgi:hypothetical protein
VDGFFLSLISISIYQHSFVQTFFYSISRPNIQLLWSCIHLLKSALQTSNSFGVTNYVFLLFIKNIQFIWSYKLYTFIVYKNIHRILNAMCIAFFVSLISISIYHHSFVQTFFYSISRPNIQLLWSCLHLFKRSFINIQLLWSYKLCCLIIYKNIHLILNAM